MLGMSGANCPRCGAPLDEGVTAGGLCARCLLAQMIETGPAEQGAEAETFDADSFGPYRRLRVLGEGGMGVVYLAEQTEPLRRLIALKVLKLGMDSRAVIARFESERQVLARMDHPNIARIFDAGTSRLGRPFFAMEYVDGLPITEYCDRALLNMRDRLQLFAEVCGAVQHAHSRGVLHRDLKPSNILVADAEGKPRVSIIDFGIAKATGQSLADRSFFTEMGQFIGTPEYMSPEQAEISAAPLDERTDVYSLGIVLYELLVGDLPFNAVELRRAGMAEILRIIREKEPPKPTTKLTTMGEVAAEMARRRRCNVKELRRQLSGDLDLIVLKCLEKERGRRYHSPANLALDIGRYLSDRPVLATAPSLVYRAGKFLRRRRREVAVSALLFGCVLALAVSLTIGSRHAPPQVPQTIVALTSYEGSQGLPSFGPDGRVAFTWNRESDGSWSIYIVSAPGQLPRRMTFGPADDSSPAWSPDGKWIAFVRCTAEHRNRLMKLNVATGVESEVLTLHSGFTLDTRMLDWSPDSRWLVVIDHAEGGWENGLNLVSIRTGEERPINVPPGKGIEYMQPAWSPDGRRIVFTRDEPAKIHITGLWLQNLTADLRADGPPLPAADASGGRHPAWTPGGDLLFSAVRGSKRFTMWMLSAGSRRAVALLALGERTGTSAVSRDGRKLVFSRNLGHGVLWRYEVHADGLLGEPNKFSSTRQSDTNPAFSPDGKQVVFLSDRSGELELWLADSTGEDARQLTFGELSGVPVWRPDGKRIYFRVADHGVARAFAIDPQGGSPTLAGEYTEVEAFSRDGKWLYLMVGKKAARMPVDGSAKPTLVTGDGVHWPKPSWDGRWLYFTREINRPGPLRRVPSGGGEEQEVAAMVDPGGFVPGPDGVYYVLTKANLRGATLYLVPNGGKPPVHVADLPHRPNGPMALAPDGKSLIMATLENEGNDLMLADFGK